jgi:hypothetical protein
MLSVGQSPKGGRLRRLRAHPAPEENMPKKSAKQKEEEAEKVIDSFESWLEKQPPKPVRARPGFIADEKIGA